MATTSGPWEVARPTIPGMTATILAPSSGGRKLIVAHVDDVDGFDGSSADNAALLASAPKLADALDKIEALLNGTTWDADVFDMIAQVVRDTGRNIDDIRTE